MTTARLCQRCGEAKHLAAFATTGFRDICKRCVSLARRARRNISLDVPGEGLAYIAGLFDGEGCVSALSRAGTSRPWLNLRAQITNTNLAALEWVRSQLGGIVYTNYPGNAQHKPCHIWVVATRGAVAALRALLPYLRIKRRQAEVLIAIHEEIWRARDEAKDLGLPIPRQDQNPEIARLRSELSALNHRGPHR